MLNMRPVLFSTLAVVKSQASWRELLSTPAFASCPGTATPKGSHWAEFVAKFPFNLHASVCDGDYSTTFAKAVQVIDEGCDGYVPPVK